MGLFGKKFDADRMLSGFQAAQATLAGDYGAAAQIWGNYADQKRKAKKDEAEALAAAEAEARIRAGLKARGLNDSDIDVIMADPRNASELIQQYLTPRQAGPEGMTMRNVDPATGQASYETSPGWHGNDYFAGSNGQRAPERLYQGERVFPVEKGGALAVYGGGQPQQSALPDRVSQWNPDTFLNQTPQGSSLTQQVDVGDPRAGALPGGQLLGIPGGPQPGTVEDGYQFMGGNPADPRSWRPVGAGGAGSGQRGFPRPY